MRKFNEWFKKTVRPSESDALAEVNANLEMPNEFLDYQTTIARLDDLLKRLQAKLKKDSNSAPHEVAILLAALKAQRAIVECLNDEYFNCAVAWDRRTGLPSHPSLIADIKKYAEKFKPADVQKTILQSFVGWTPLTQQVMDCTSGRDFRLKKTAIDIFTNIMLRVENGTLWIRQIVGVKADDPSHATRYKYGRISKQIDGCKIIFESSGSVKISSHGALVVRHRFQEHDDLFAAAKFVKLVRDSI